MTVFAFFTYLLYSTQVKRAQNRNLKGEMRVRMRSQQIFLHFPQTTPQRRHSLSIVIQQLAWRHAWRGARVPCALAETHRDTLSAQRAAATKLQRVDIKLVTCAQLSEAGS